MSRTLSERSAGIGAEDGRTTDWSGGQTGRIGAIGVQACTSREGGWRERRSEGGAPADGTGPRDGRQASPSGDAQLPNHFSQLSVDSPAQGDEALRLQMQGRQYDGMRTCDIAQGSGPTSTSRWRCQGSLYDTGGVGWGDDQMEENYSGEASFWSGSEPDGVPGPSLMDDVGDEWVRIKAHQMVTDHLVPGLPPIQADVVTEVPLWLAIRLASCDRCELLLPQWVGRDHLQEVLLKEASSEAFIVGLPFLYYEFFRLLWAKARHVLPDGPHLLTLVEQIHTQRLVKADRLVPKTDLDDGEFSNLGHAELRKIRPVVRAIAEARRLLFDR
ncbi:unnamed protein product [Ostreobium quekettii]|uniref:GINS subunit domain-containing protein n=1 Tax=Ostreobium quekettii TaxID=121088 RepID=A0A8S1JG17_9CHLO|nr:unnamed protein product [Ostreobium quekettii]|eukprot:evm.model.scf_1442.6 EVM.evm.TU.scf_1442.6   scf_1442:27350-30489(-)